MPGHPTTKRTRHALQTTQPAATGDPRPTPLGSPAPGSVLDGYHIDRPLGSGGFAEVFQVTTPLDATLAMKVLRPDLAAVRAEHARFRREPRLMNAVKHPGIPRALADGVTPDGRPYFVMDWIDGETLDARAARLGGRLPVREVQRIGLQLAGVLHAVHAAGVLHLDVKPENVFATRHGRVMLGDFGIAQWTNEAGGRTGLQGTPMFMAPEQVTGIGLGPWTDVRALGATLFALLTGRTTCSTRALRTTFGRIFAPARLVGSVMPSAPRPLARLIDRCLAVDPARRPPTRELREALQVSF